MSLLPSASAAAVALPNDDDDDTGYEPQPHDTSPAPAHTTLPLGTVELTYALSTAAFAWQEDQKKPPAEQRCPVLRYCYRMKNERGWTKTIMAIFSETTTVVSVGGTYTLPT